MSTLEKGYLLYQKVETQQNTSLVGYEKKIPAVLISNPSSDIIEEKSNVSPAKIEIIKEDKATEEVDDQATKTKTNDDGS